MAVLSLYSTPIPGRNVPGLEEILQSCLSLHVPSSDPPSASGDLRSPWTLPDKVNGLLSFPLAGSPAIPKTHSVPWCRSQMKRCWVGERKRKGRGVQGKLLFLGRDSDKVSGWSPRRDNSVEGTELERSQGVNHLYKMWISPSPRAPGKQLVGVT